MNELFQEGDCKASTRVWFSFVTLRTYYALRAPLKKFQFRSVFTCGRAGLLYVGLVSYKTGLAWPQRVHAPALSEIISLVTRDISIPSSLCRTFALRKFAEPSIIRRSVPESPPSSAHLCRRVACGR